MKKFLLIGTIFFYAISAQADFADGENFFDNGEFARAFSEFLPLANNGDFRSQYYIGYLYLNGLGVAQDLKLAIKYLQQSSDQEYDMAQSLMAFLYEKGEAIPKDMKKALSLYRKAAAQNNASANLNLGVMYYNGDHLPKDLAKALEHFKKVPLDEKPVAARYIADIYLNNEAFKDPASAVQYYKYAAKQDDLDAFYALGEMYRKGQGVPVNKTEAFNYYLYAASKGYAPAQYMLGLMYINGDGVSGDQAKGHAWLTLASEQKFVNAQKALDKISEFMEMADFDKARYALSGIQENELAKVAMPSFEGADMSLVTNKTSTKNQIKSVKRRRGIRSRRSKK